MPHLPEHNPLVTIQREINNIFFLLSRGELEFIPARLDFMVQAHARLVTEQEKLKSAFKQKAREANLMRLRCVHWQQQYERSEAERYRMQRLASDEAADHHATRAELGNERIKARRLEAELAALKGVDDV